MSSEVKNVSEVVKGAVNDIKNTAREVADKLRQRTDEAKMALDMVNQFGDDLGNATNELRALLGSGTNNPPPDPLPTELPKKKGLLG